MVRLANRFALAFVGHAPNSKGLLIGFYAKQNFCFYCFKSGTPLAGLLIANLLGYDSTRRFALLSYACQAIESESRE